MICRSCLRDWPAVCYVCDPEADERKPLGWDWPSGVIEDRPLQWAIDRFAAPDWDALSADETLVALAIRRRWVAPEDQEAVAATADTLYIASLSAKPVGGSHLGTHGARSTHVLTCTGVKSIGMGDYGERFLISFTGPEGQAVVWFTGEGGKFQPEPGKQYSVTASIEHGEYSGAKQTIIKRPKGEAHDECAAVL